MDGRGHCLTGASALAALGLPRSLGLALSGVWGQRHGERLCWSFVCIKNYIVLVGRYMTLCRVFW